MNAPTAPYTFLGGTAGTGKTTLVRQWAAEDETILLCATTGIAAINLGGTTINAMLGYFDTDSLQIEYELGRLHSRLKRLAEVGYTRLVVDEVSMMDGRQLDILCLALDELHDRDADLSMGLTLVGDMCQLPPVKAPFVFEAKCWDRFEANTTLLTEPRRQADPRFVRALQALRRGDVPNSLPIFTPRITRSMDPQYAGTTLMAKNDEVDRHNKLRLLRCPGTAFTLRSDRWGQQRPEWKHIPETLELKDGALVMILANRRVLPQSTEFLYVNGDLGVVEDHSADFTRVRLQRTDAVVTVEPVTRKFTVPGERGKAIEILGEITYMPLRLAYATTVHKCVAASTRMEVNGQIVPASQVQTGDQLAHGGRVLATATSRQRGYAIQTRRGYTCVASADHRWWTDDGWRTTRQLAKYMSSPWPLPAARVRLALGTPCSARGDAHAWFLGALVGNGTYTDQADGTLHFATTYQALGTAWAQQAKREGVRTASWRKDGCGLHTTCRALRTRLYEEGLDYVTCRNKQVPTWVWGRGPAAWKGFLQGLFDADGSVGRSGVILSTSAPLLGLGVHELLLALGVVSTLRRYPGVKAPYWQIYIGAASLSAFRQVGFRHHPEKRAKLKALQPNRIIQPAEDSDWVIAVTDTTQNIDMVDVEVAAPHIVGFGPLLGHNSQGLSLDRLQMNIGAHFWTQPGMLYVAASRARTLEGLKIVGLPQQFAQRTTVNAKVRPWL